MRKHRQRSRRFACPEECTERLCRRPETGRPAVLYPAESAGLHQTDLIPDRDRTADSLSPGFETARGRPGLALLEHNIRKLETPSGFQDTKDLPEAGKFVG